jgi:two-component system chemotaxis response regulator CheB
VNIQKRNKLIRVLVVDDSPLIRDLIAEILTSEPGIEIIGTASNGQEAVSKVSLLKPNLITMDIEMPVMDGFEAIECIMRENPTPILVVTAMGGVRTAFSAVSKGALDVVEKPDISIASSNSLINKVRMLAGVDITAHLAVRSGNTGAGAGQLTVRRKSVAKGKIVAIASSTGGPKALQAILSQLPADFPAPIVVAQHIADGFTQGMAEWLGGNSPFMVRVARNGDHLSPGVVHVNPAEFSMQVTRQGMVILNERIEREKYHPSCDALLRSVADAYREEAVGLILSGMGDDGVDGMRAIRAAGGVTLAQDAESSVVYGMNRLAVEQGHIGWVLALDEIPSELGRLIESFGR